MILIVVGSASHVARVQLPLSVYSFTRHVLTIFEGISDINHIARLLRHRGNKSSLSDRILIRVQSIVNYLIGVHECIG